MIGFYDYTVIVTYLSLVISAFGMMQAIEGNFTPAIVCLALSGLCDMFDGKIARSKKNRTDDEKLFGVQIDSLCDVICFGAFPGMLCYLLGVRTPIGLIGIAYYFVCSVIRLAYFNVLETNRQQVEEGANKYYHGLPITTMAIILPLVYFVQLAVPGLVFLLILKIMLFLVGTLFVVDFKLKKPDNKTLTMIVIIVGIAVALIVLLPRLSEVRFEFPKKIRWPFIK